MNPTEEMYRSLQDAFDHFNRLLFTNSLPKVIFTVQRKKGMMGHFAPDRWGNLGGKQCHEIAINPAYIANSRLIEVMQTLVHEMVHCWQYCFGSPGRDYYHNKDWALKMIKVGLMPSTTGEPGGAITGQHMGDYIIEGGEFLSAFNELKNIMHFQLSWIDRKALPRLFEPVIAATGTDEKKPDKAATLTTASLVSSNPETGRTQSSSILAHYLPPNEQSYSELMPESFFVHDLPQKKTRYRYICYGCHSKVYGKPNLNIRCDDCDNAFECEEIS
jgi:SprT-like family